MGYNPNSDYKTSKGNIAPDQHWSGDDDAYTLRSEIKRRIEQDFSGARVVRPSTRKYNCHGYAHAERHAWFDYINQFIEDDYYPFTPGTLRVNDIVVYEKGGTITHSAKIISLNGNTIQNLRSKWGAWSEVVHQASNVPNDYGSIRWYLRQHDMLLRDDPRYFDMTAPDAIGDLIAALSDESVLLRLDLVDNPDVALAVCRSLPEISGLALYGALAQKKLVEALQAAESFEVALPILAALSVNSPKNALKPTASKLIELHRNEEGVTIAELAVQKLLLEIHSTVSFQEDSFDVLNFARELI